jgi:hypothetical protein
MSIRKKVHPVGAANGSDKIISVTRHTNTATGDFYRPFIGRSAGNSRYLRQVLQTVRCMQNLQSRIQRGFQLCG